MSLKFLKRLLILCFIFLGSTQYTYADKPEYQVKALSLVLFLKYISFNDKRDEFHIGVFGDNPFAGHLKKFDGQKIKNRKIRIHLFQNNLEEASRKNCHLIFLSNSEVLKQADLIKKLSTPNNLIVGDNKWFIKSGGMINLHILNDEVRWDTNKSIIDKKNLKVDYQIYELSTNKGGSK